MTQTLDDTDVVVLEDLDFEEPCGACGAEAVWRWSAKCCGLGGNLCARHDASERILFTLFVAAPGMHCRGCRQDLIGPEPEDSYWIEKVKR